MSTAKTWQTVSSSSADTSAIGRRLGHACKGGEILLLVSDLGGGKTTLVQGLAKGLESSDHVGSPTFTISKVYKCRDNLELQHFDFYRLNDAGVVAYELAEVIDDPKSIIAIEWGDIVTDSLPAERLEIILRRIGDDEDARDITIKYPLKYDYLMKELV